MKFGNFPVPTVPAEQSYKDFFKFWEEFVMEKSD